METRTLAVEFEQQDRVDGELVRAVRAEERIALLLVERADRVAPDSVRSRFETGRTY